ncbi:hypothetical protein P865_04570 [Brucella abortus 82]|nr:hypothetical protein M798_08620 [Brucella melitensis ADMAS-G1]ERM87069.1 hypothetical protein P865_04570 [Brucella abortus 82]EXU82339.1 hypothetical protein AX23_14175 [Brucella melitensis 548]
MPMVRFQINVMCILLLSRLILFLSVFQLLTRLGIQIMVRQREFLLK